MTDMLKFDSPKEQSSIIKVIGVGGGGSNAVSHMYKQGIKGVDFYICNTDVQSLSQSPVPNKIPLGQSGLGAGANPVIARDSAQQKAVEIRQILENNTSLLFVTAGMGGGTGTGAAPIIAQIAKEMGILTVGIVTKPFGFEGRKRLMQAENGIEELRKFVDTILVICNDKLLDLQGDMKLGQAFAKADDVLTTAAKGIAEIITVTGRVNVDFEDVKAVMKESGKAIMGTGIASGPDRAMEAVQMALTSPLLDDIDIRGAENVLLYITSGQNEISLEELSDITGFITSRAGEKANIVWGDGIDEKLDDEITVTIIATGFDKKNRLIHQLDEEQVESNTIPLQILQPEPVNEIRLVEKRPVPSAPIFDEIPKQESIKIQNDPLTLFEKPKTAAPEEAPKESPATVEPLSIKPMDAEPVLEVTNATTPEVPVAAAPSGTFTPDTDKLDQQQAERQNKLRGMSLKFNSPSDIEKLEKTPAYMRKNIDLPEFNSSDTNVSRFSLQTDSQQKTGLRENNSYLFDTVD